MKVFITGATGYIGGKIAMQLANNGNTVHALVRSKPCAQLSEHPNIKLFNGEIADKESLANAMDQCEQAYHVAAFAKVWSKDPHTYYDVNVAGTVNVMECAKKCGVKKMVFTSSGSTLNSSSYGLVDEDDAVMHNFTNDYERSKFAAESIVKDFVIKGQHIVIVNPTRVYGPGLSADSGALNNMIFRYLLGKWRVIPGNGNSIGNFVFIDDVVKGHLLAMENGKSGARYLIGGENATFNDFFAQLKKISGLDYAMVHLPMAVVNAFAFAQLAGAKLFNAEPAITPVWAKKNNYHWERYSTKAANELGYEYLSLCDGFTKTIQWLVETQPGYQAKLKQHIAQNESYFEKALLS